MADRSMRRTAVRMLAGLACAIVVAAPAVAASYQQIFAFKGGAGGTVPVGKLTELDGVLYGATSNGGGKCDCGTAYRLTLIGKHHVIHDFAGTPGDGAYPGAGLVDLRGVLYGTTESGGAHACPFTVGDGCGTVFSVTPAGVETVLHSFDSTAGYIPRADLLVRGGSLWGTESFLGGVFETATSGTTRSFTPDAVYSRDYGGLINVGGVFYGAANDGGHECYLERFGGSIYAITPRGTAKTVYDFTCKADGAKPSGTLLYANGLLYGTTPGTIFSLSLSGTLTTLHSVTGGGDVGLYNPGFTLFNGVIYGVSSDGGGTGCAGGGCGTIYTITPSGTVTILYHFQGGADGAYPNGRLLNFHGGLYGVTSAGGPGGFGTVFRFTP